MAELAVFSKEVKTVVKIAITTALDIAGQNKNDESAKEPDSKTQVSYWPAKREVTSPRVDNDKRLLWAYPKYCS